MTRVLSYTKATFNEQILKPINLIHKETLDDNDFTEILTYLNAFMLIGENITCKNARIGELWNEIISDTLASLCSASSGFYRSAIIVLRSILELGCNSFFYYDHPIEYQMFKQENLKADKYVSTLVNDYSFFATKYIKTFLPEIEDKQSSINSVSDFLKKNYGELSDSLHGRYNNLTKTDGLQLKYDKVWFKRYEKHFLSVLSILAVLYVLRFKDTSDANIKSLAKKSKVVSI